MVDSLAVEIVAGCWLKAFAHSLRIKNQDLIMDY
jgi:hypothetical protein